MDRSFWQRWRRSIRIPSLMIPLMRAPTNFERPTSNFERREENGLAEQVYDLEERFLEYAARICGLAEQIPRTRAGNHVAKQLLRSGAAPLPNHGEAQAAESREDFLHKMRICLKELRESKRWMLLIQRVPLLKIPSNLDPLVRETEEL